MSEKNSQVSSERKAKTIAYLRVSSGQQDIGSQKLALHDYAHRNDLKIDEFIEIEMSSRKSPKARKIDELIECLHAGDLLLVSELSRLGRSVGQVIQIVDALIKNEIRFVSVKEAIRINGRQDIQTKTMITMFGLFAEIERDLISERTKQGLAAARQTGTCGGKAKREAAWSAKG